jgi:hypothetical protein
MPMLVTFKKRDSTTISLGPFEALRFEGAKLHAGDGKPIAKHENHHWLVRGEEYLRLDCDGPLTIAFLDSAGKPSRQFGPCAHFSSVGGIGYRDHEVFCHLDMQTNRWHLRAEQRDWAVLVVAHAKPAHAGGQ